jgi:hypothetical protein
MTVMHEEWTEKLSDYLDGELAADERYAVESHLSGCAHCAGVLNELTRVVARARSVQPRPPQADLWAGIVQRIEAPSRDGNVAPFASAAARLPVRIASRRISLSFLQLATAAVLLIAVSGGIVWSIANRPQGISDTSSADRQLPRDSAPTTSGDFQVRRDDDVQVAAISFADQQYDAAVSDLEKALNKGRGRLDAGTIAIVEHNLQIIDQAIAQARQALTDDPANGYLSGHLVEARRRKLDLLRRAAALTGETD